MNILEYLGLGKKKTRKMRGKIIEPQSAIFDYRKGKIKPASLEGLSWSVSDFTKHAKSVLNETGYGIMKVTERGDLYGVYYAQIEVYKLSKGPERFLGNSYAGTIALTDFKRKPVINVHEKEGSGLKDYARRLQNYDLSKLIK